MSYPRNEQHTPEDRAHLFGQAVAVGRYPHTPAARRLAQDVLQGETIRPAAWADYFAPTVTVKLGRAATNALGAKLFLISRSAMVDLGKPSGKVSL